MSHNVWLKTGRFRLRVIANLTFFPGGDHKLPGFNVSPAVCGRCCLCWLFILVSIFHLVPLGSLFRLHSWWPTRVWAAVVPQGLGAVLRVQPVLRPPASASCPVLWAPACARGMCVTSVALWGPQNSQQVATLLMAPQGPGTPRQELQDACSYPKPEQPYMNREFRASGSPVVGLWSPETVVSDSGSTLCLFGEEDSPA